MTKPMRNTLMTGYLFACLGILAFTGVVLAMQQMGVIQPGRQTLMQVAGALSLGTLPAIAVALYTEAKPLFCEWIRL